MQIDIRSRITRSVSEQVRPCPQSNRIRLCIPPPPAPVPAEDVVILLLPFPVHGYFLAGEAERLVGAFAGAHFVDVAEGFVFGLPDARASRVRLQDRRAEVVGEGVERRAAWGDLGDGAAGAPH